MINKEQLLNSARRNFDNNFLKQFNKDILNNLIKSQDNAAIYKKIQDFKEMNDISEDMINIKNIKFSENYNI